MRRDELVEVNDVCWTQLRLSLDPEQAGQTLDTNPACKCHKIAKARAMVTGTTCRPVDQPADPSQSEDTVRRLLTVEQQAMSGGHLNKAVGDAIPGGVSEPKTTVSEAVDIYKTKSTLDTIRSKSPVQKNLWHATKDLSPVQGLASTSP